MLLTKHRHVDKHAPLYLDKYHKEVGNVSDSRLGVLPGFFFVHLCTTCLGPRLLDFSS
jgi:hypothetical protein